MTELSPDAIAARLVGAQRRIVLSGPISVSEADSLPEGLFDYDLSKNGKTGDETHFWQETDLGRKVRETLLSQRT